MLFRNLFFAVLCLMSACDFPHKKSSDIENKRSTVIGFSMSSYKVERWTRDISFFTQRANELGADVVSLTANDDPMMQIAQIRNFITQGVNVIVIVGASADGFGPVIEEAHKAGIPVIAYDRLLKNCDLDMFVSFDSEKVGRYQAQYIMDKIGGKGKIAYVGGCPSDNNAYLLKKGAFEVLQPAIDRRDVQLVLSSFTPLWEPSEAYKMVKSYLNVSTQIDAVVAANDGLALGTIQALGEYDLAGKAPVSGQDASLGGCQRIVEGTQAVTIYKPIKDLARKCADIAVALANKRKAEVNAKIFNGLKDVDGYYLDVIPVDKDNMQEVIIKGGFQSYEDVYQNTIKK